MSDLSYPIGKLEFDPDVTDAKRRRWIKEIEAAPARLRSAVSGLSDEQLDTPYRPDGWTVRQVVHHVFDSHLNSYVRFKWVLTEDEPTIKAYDQDRWARLEEARTAPVEMSLTCLDALHARWVLMLRSLSARDLARSRWHARCRHAAVRRPRAFADSGGGVRATRRPRAPSPRAASALSWTDASAGAGAPRCAPR